MQLHNIFSDVHQDYLRLFARTVNNATARLQCHGEASMFAKMV